MGERENALAAHCLHIETPTDEQLATEMDDIQVRHEINRRSNNGITVVAYWMGGNAVRMYVHDARNNGSAEYDVDPAQVTEEFTHPFANPNTFDIPTYRQAENDE